MKTDRSPSTSLREPSTEHLSLTRDPTYRSRDILVERIFANKFNDASSFEAVPYGAAEMGYIYGHAAVLKYPDQYQVEKR